MPAKKSIDLSQPLTLKQLDAINVSDLNRARLRQYWAARGTAHLRGKTVSHVEYITDEEMRESEWHSHAPVIVFTDGSMLIAQSDNEGNGPGAARFVGIDDDKPVSDMLYTG